MLKPNEAEAVNITAQRMVAISVEQEQLERNPTKSNEMRHQRLAQEFAALKAGCTSQDYAAYKNAQLRKELHIEEKPISRDAFDEWRNWLASGERELRTDSQATSMWGNVVGETYDGPSGAQGKGGVLVPATAPFTDRIYSMLASTDEIIDPANCRVWTSEKGSAGNVPYVLDYAVTGSPAAAAFNASTEVDESVQSNTTQFATGSLAFGKVKTARSGRIAIALELAQDAPELFAGTVALLEACFAQRFALWAGKYAVTQLLANLPTIQNVKLTGAGTPATDIWMDDIVNLYNALPLCYRKQAIIVCSDTVRGSITHALEAATRTLVGPINEALRVPIAVSPSMPALDQSPITSNVLAVMVDRRYLVQRRVRNNGNIVRAYREAVGIIEQGLTAVEHFGRFDFGCVNLADPYFSPAAVLTRS